ncbi:MAG: DNA polymerase/3'-5' exonuclease PolX [Candidatus Promineofilum sp.]|nr:DNA polymerase/3'-5' exonuclease PolX [Promineifilum sp.]MBP9656727.1 DNA polymerase/3'-5' exonuclease PolX [Promineifilum sp.]
MKNRDIVEIFGRIADMLAIRGDQIHRILAYRRAAESIEALGRDINTVYAEGRLTDIPGIGDTLAAKIEELLTSGKLEFYDKLSREIPPTLVDLLRVEGLGPKRVKQIYDSLNITTLDELTIAARQGKLRDLPGMGAKSEAKLVAAIEALSRHGDNRVPLGVAWPIAQQMIAALRQVPGVKLSAVGGSLRRMKDTIGDIDLLVAADSPEQVMDRFGKLDMVESVEARGPTRSRVSLLTGLGVDLRVLPAERWGTLLAYFTGNKDHNVKLREMALKLGYSLNEHSFTPLDGGPEILCATEEEVYARLGLPYIPPMLREDRGEIEAAKAGKLPSLVELEDIRSDLHMHTEWSDGTLSILEMARAARNRGLNTIAITDHSVSLGIANGLSIERLQQQAAEVQMANNALGPDFHVLHGTEMEIRADGSLDYPDDILKQLDFVIASLHTGLSQPREQATQRMLNAINNPHVDMIAHPTGRLLPDRAGADLDMDAIIAAAAATGTILEINANPARLDLRDIHARMAVEHGVKIAINTDAHRPEEFELRHFGVATAQRGWVESANVINTWSYERLREYLNRNNS